MKKVAIGLSGGVDSAVSALLLKERGYEVIGLFMKNWEEENCPAEQDFQDVRRIADLLEIPYYTFNFTKEYWDSVFSEFLDELKLGYTPNPDILCNREIKFKVFFQKALHLGADFLATGHYCQVEEGGSKLLRAIDENKDQTYFLYTLKKEQLKKILFPIGHLPKPRVKEIARERGFIVADKKESTGICFIGKRKFSSFISAYLPPKKGDFLSLDGKKLGTHEGIQFYTIGQRKGIGLGGNGEAWFVCKKNPEENTITLCQGTNHPALFGNRLSATDVSFIDEFPTLPLRCSAKIRYRQKDQPCVIKSFENNELIVEFDSPVRAITARQSIVFYIDNICLGGALIKSQC